MVPPRPGWLSAAVALSVLCAHAPAAGQTAPGPRPNSYTLAEEAALGREAASSIRSRLGRFEDPQIEAYAKDLTQRLADALPAELRHAGFDYTSIVLDESEVMSVAAPSGPVFISRAMLVLAPGDAALAGLLAHELSHVALRHATAQVTTGEQYQLGALTGRVIGAAVSGQDVGILSRGAQFAMTSYFLTYDSTHDQQADRLAAEIMERSGFPADALAAMFQTARTEGLARGGAWWAMRHPSKHRDGVAAPTDAAGRGADEPTSPTLASIQTRLRAARGPQPASSARPVPLGTVGYSVLPPAGESRSVTAGDLLQMSVPANWDRIVSGNTVIFAPQGAYLQVADGATAVTHGLQIGIARSLTGTLHGDIHMLLATLGRNNPSITWTTAFQQVTIADRLGVTTAVSNVSPATGEFEQVLVSAAHLPDGSLLYVTGVAPQGDAGTYRDAYNRVLGSIQILE